MNEEAEINELLDCSLKQVDLEFLHTNTEKDVLNKYLASLKTSRSVRELYLKLKKACEKLEGLGLYKSCDVKVLPGNAPDTALVSFDLHEHKIYALSAGADANNEGGRTSFSASFRNLRKKADLTDIKTEYKPNTKTYGFEFLHYDKLFIPGRWESTYAIKHGNEELDINLRESSYGGHFGLKSTNGKFSFELGRTIRTNIIKAEHASLSLIKSALPTTAKNYFSQTFSHSTLDHPLFPRSGIKLLATNEFAYGSDNTFHKLDLKFSHFFGLTPSIVLQTSLNSGFFFPYVSNKITINDLYRIRFIKGFTSIGTREPAADYRVLSKYQINGDNIGNFSKLVSEAKVHFYDCPYLHEAGFVPFVYGNLICEAPHKIDSLRNYCREFVRAAVGFGLGWNTAAGRIELVYSAKAYKKSMDIGADFQILFGD